MNTDQIDDLRETLSHAKACLEAWWIAEGDDDPSLHAKLQLAHGRYLHYFEIIQPALFITFVTKLTSAFDDDPTSISLKILPDYEAFPEFASLWDRGRRIYKYRNKVIAHRDRQVPIRNFAQETGYTYNNLRTIMNDTCRLFDFCAERHSLERVRQLFFVSEIHRFISDSAKTA